MALIFYSLASETSIFRDFDGLLVQIYRRQLTVHDEEEGDGFQNTSKTWEEVKKFSNTIWKSIMHIRKKSGHNSYLQTRTINVEGAMIVRRLGVI